MTRGAVIIFWLFFSVFAYGQVGINTTEPKTMLDVNGGVSFRESPVALNLSNGNNNNIDIGSTPYSFYRITGPTNAFNISGIIPLSGSNGQLLTLVNTTSHSMTLVHDDTSTSINRIFTPGGRNLVLTGINSTVTLQYNASLSRWIVQSYSDAGAYGRNVYHVLGTTDISTNTDTYSNMDDMSITFTPKHSVVYLNFSASGNMEKGVNNDSQGYASFRIRRDATTIAGTTVNATDRSLNWNPLLINGFPYTETFETDSPTSGLWVYQILQGGTAWVLATGAGVGTITTAHSGTRNARFQGINNNRTLLISPFIDITLLTNPKISFWYGQELNGVNQNQLKVHYRISETDPWFQIAHYTGNTNTWTYVELDLPNSSSTYQIAFEGIGSGSNNANRGRSNVIDDVTIFGDTPVGYPVFNLDTAWNAGFTMYPVTVTPGVETTISIQWMRDGKNPRALQNNVSTDGERFHRSLMIMD